MKNLVIFYFFAFILALSGCQGGGSSSSNTNDSTDTSDTTDTTDNSTDDSTDDSDSTDSSDNNTDDSTDTSDSTDSSTPITPNIVSLTPAADSSNVSVDSTLSITFNTELNASTVTTSTNTECTGSVQLSADNFVTCAPLSVSTSDNKTFVFTPTEDLKHLHTYHVHITTNVATAEGETLQANYTSSEGFTTANISGVFDTAFSGDGKVVYLGNEYMENKSGDVIALDSQGRIFVAGSIYINTPATYEDAAIWCYTENGELCDDFGSGGIVTLDRDERDDFINDLLIDEDDYIYALGDTEICNAGGTACDSEATVWKLDASGNLVNAFGGDGMTTFGLYGDITDDNEESSWVSHGGFDASGNLILLGGARNHLWDIQSYIAKINTLNGAFDTSFDSDGLLTFESVDEGGSVTYNNIQFYGLLLEGSDIYITGLGDYDPYNRDVLVGKFNSDGTPNTAFGGNGFVFNRTIIDDAANESGKALALTESGKLIIAGVSANQDGDDLISLWRFDATTGAADTSFGTDGAVFQPFLTDDAAYTEGQASAQMRTMILDSEENILVGGSSRVNFSLEYGVVYRFNSDGAIDTDFGDNGVIKLSNISSHDRAEKTDYINALYFNQNGRLLVAGMGYGPDRNVDDEGSIVQDYFYDMILLRLK